MKIVSEEDLQGHGRETLRGMAEGAAGGLAVAIPGSLYLNRRWAYYRRLPITIKVLGVVLVTAPAIAAQAERRGVQYDKEHNWSGVAKNEMDHEALEEEQRWRHLSFSQKAGEWALHYRWHLFVAGWATSLGAAWLLLSRNKTQTFSQKIVQARVYAQGIALTGLIGGAALSQMQSRGKAKEDPTQHSWARLLEQQARDAQEHEVQAHSHS